MEREMMSEVKARIEEAVRSNKVMLFMKGAPEFPQCGFSARAVEILQRVGAKFGAMDVLADPDVRQGIKDYSSWPTIPQLYVDGEFVGGADIMLELYQSGELQQMIEQSGAKEAVG